MEPRVIEDAVLIDSIYLHWVPLFSLHASSTKVGMEPALIIPGQCRFLLCPQADPHHTLIVSSSRYADPSNFFGTGVAIERLSDPFSDRFNVRAVKLGVHESGENELTPGRSRWWVCATEIRPALGGLAGIPPLPWAATAAQVGRLVPSPFYLAFEDAYLLLQRVGLLFQTVILGSYGVVLCPAHIVLCLQRLLARSNLFHLLVLPRNHIAQACDQPCDFFPTCLWRFWGPSLPRSQSRHASCLRCRRIPLSSPR